MNTHLGALYEMIVSSGRSLKIGKIMNVTNVIISICSIFLCVFRVQFCSHTTDFVNVKRNPKYQFLSERKIQCCLSF